MTARLYWLLTSSNVCMCVSLSARAGMHEGAGVCVRMRAVLMASLLVPAPLGCLFGALYRPFLDLSPQDLEL